MSLKACGINPYLNITPQRRELQPHGTLDFPSGGYAECYTPAPDRALPWPWPDDLEIIYILSGEMTADIPGQCQGRARGGAMAFHSA